MCIERKVFEDIINKYPQIKYKTDIRAKIDDHREKKEVLGNDEYAFSSYGARSNK